MLLRSLLVSVTYVTPVPKGRPAISKSKFNLAAYNVEVGSIIQGEKALISKGAKILNPETIGNNIIQAKLHAAGQVLVILTEHQAEIISRSVI